MTGARNTPEITDVAFTSHGVRCAAWHVRASSTALRRNGKRPCIVMAHGFGGTRDSGLMTFAAGFASAGIDAYVFDYRGFGASDGAPRQVVSYRMQREDYRAAIDAAHRLHGADPDRIALWGTSWSGGHVLAVAAGDPSIAAVAALVPAPDGAAVLPHMIRHSGPFLLPRLVAHGLRDAMGALVGGAPHRIPLAAEPGRIGILTTPGASEGYTAIAGPTWRNEVCARAVLEVALNRPITAASKVTCPVLIQIGAADRVVPPSAGRRAARNLSGTTEVKEYPVDHFDVYTGTWQATALADEVDFFVRVLS